MNADVAKQEETCEPTSQQKFRDAIGLRTKHLNSESVTFEEKLGAVHLELTGEDLWPAAGRGSSSRTHTQTHENATQVVH